MQLSVAVGSVQETTALHPPGLLDTVLLEEMSEVVFKLRAFTESADDGDLALGIEIGMQRAADMIENVLNRHIGKEIE